MYTQKYLYPEAFLQRNVKIQTAGTYTKMQISSLLYFITSPTICNYDIHYRNYLNKIISSEYKHYKLEKK